MCMSLLLTLFLILGDICHITVRSFFSIQKGYLLNFWHTHFLESISHSFKHILHLVAKLATLPFALTATAAAVPTV